MFALPLLPFPLLFKKTMGAHIIQKALCIGHRETWCQQASFHPQPHYWVFPPQFFHLSIVPRILWTPPSQMNMMIDTLNFIVHSRLPFKGLHTSPLLWVSSFHSSSLKSASSILVQFEKKLCFFPTQPAVNPSMVYILLFPVLYSLLDCKLFEHKTSPLGCYLWKGRKWGSQGC